MIKIKERIENCFIKLVFIITIEKHGIVTLKGIEEVLKTCLGDVNKKKIIIFIIY